MKKRFLYFDVDDEYVDDDLIRTQPRRKRNRDGFRDKEELMSFSRKHHPRDFHKKRNRREQMENWSG